MVTNNQFGVGTALEHHSAVTDLHRRGEGFGVPGMRCDGMDVVETHHVMTEAIRRAREDRQPVLVEAVTYRFRGHSMADPEEYRSKEQVAEWRKRDPITTFADRLYEEEFLEEGEADKLDEAATKQIDEAVTFADKSDFPPPESLYDHIYVLGDQVRGWYSVDERSPGVHRGEDERERAVDPRMQEAYDKQVAESDEGTTERPADQAQADDEDATEAEDRARPHDGERGG
jgi:hypothetical protein